jgi:predicted MFS family arabinose efflux permease
MFPTPPDGDSARSPVRRAPGVVGLAALFGAIYFIQGIAEPTEGLIAQPVRSLLRDWGRTATDIGWFMGIMGLPWAFKPLFGLLIDFVPLGRARRRNWLILATAASSVGLAWLSGHLPPPGSHQLLLVMLVIPTAAVALADVVADALMVEYGQPLGMTDRLQSVQWSAMWGATILTGTIGGWISENRLYEVGFLICSAASSVSLVLALVWMRERPVAGVSDPGNVGSDPNRSGLTEAGYSDSRPAPTVKMSGRLSALWGALRTPRFLAAAAFLFLWNFNPFSSAVQQTYMTRELGLSEQFYGHTVSLFAVGSLAGCVAFGGYCHRIPKRWLIHLSIAAGVLTTATYAGLTGKWSAAAISVVSGFTYMTGSLIQLDLAARVCPPQVAGTVFASLMALSNLGITAGIAWGGNLYDRWTLAWGADQAFDMLVAVGAATTAACWVLIPWLRGPTEERKRITS